MFDNCNDIQSESESLSL